MIPVLLVTGFLGSGKTTLLNALMAARPPSPGKLAIIVNEFGDIGIDGSLLPEEMTRQVELPGGCICCALDEDLEKTLLQLVEGEPALEAIVVETTGIAEPLPISWTLARDPLAGLVRLATVITVVDALEHETHRPLSPSVDNQVEYADLLVISKVDLAPGAEPPPALLESLRELNPHAPTLWANREELGDLLWSALEDPEGRSTARASETTRGDHSAAHEHGFRSASAVIPDILDFEELTSQLEELPPSYVRIKGVAMVVDGSTGSEEAKPVAFHRVGARVSVEPIARAEEPRIVALGPEVDADRLAACVRAAVLTSS